MKMSLLRPLPFNVLSLFAFAVVLCMTACSSPQVEEEAVSTHYECGYIPISVQLMANHAFNEIYAFSEDSSFAELQADMDFLQAYKGNSIINPYTNAVSSAFMRTSELLVLRAYLYHKEGDEERAEWFKRYAFYHALKAALYDKDIDRVIHMKYENFSVLYEFEKCYAFQQLMAGKISKKDYLERQKELENGRNTYEF